MDVEWEHAVVLLLTGTLVALGILIKWGLARTALPALVGYLLLGFLLRVTGSAAGVLTEGMVTHFGFLADIGVIAPAVPSGLGKQPGRTTRPTSQRAAESGSATCYSAESSAIARLHICWTFL